MTHYRNTGLKGDVFRFRFKVSGVYIKGDALSTIITKTAFLQVLLLRLIETLNRLILKDRKV